MPIVLQKLFFGMEVSRQRTSRNATARRRSANGTAVLVPADEDAFFSFAISSFLYTGMDPTSNGFYMSFQNWCENNYQRGFDIVREDQPKYFVFTSEFWERHQNLFTNLVIKADELARRIVDIGVCSLKHLYAFGSACRASLMCFICGVAVGICQKKTLRCVQGVPTVPILLREGLLDKSTEAPLFFCDRKFVKTETNHTLQSATQPLATPTWQGSSEGSSLLLETVPAKVGEGFRGRATEGELGCRG